MNQFQPGEPHDGLTYRCGACGGRLVFDIAKQAMVCGQCGQTANVDSLPDPTIGEKGRPDTEIVTYAYSCPSCGAVLHATQTGATSCCSFCGADVVLTERVSRMLRPARIVPFTVTREKCEQIYRKRLHESRCVPADLSSQETISRFRPVYIPFWNLSARASGKSSGTRTETRSGPFLASYHYRDVYEMELEGEVSVSGLVYDGSSSFDDDTAQWLDFDHSQSVPFHPAYLAGCYAETPDVDPVIFKGMASSLLSPAFNRGVASQSGHSSCSAQTPSDPVETAELVLMPVWLLAAREGESVACTAISGQSRNIRCDLPVSRKRFLRLAAITAAIVAVLLILIDRLNVIPLRPKLTASLSCLLAALSWNALLPLHKALKKEIGQDPTRSVLKAKNEYRMSLGQRFRPSRSELDRDQIFSRYGSSHDTWKSYYLIRPLYILIVSLVFLHFLGLFYLGEQNKALFLDSLFGDNAWLPPLICGATLVLFLVMFSTTVWLDMKYRVLYLAQTAVCLVFVLTMLFIHLAWPYYAVGIANIIVTLLLMLHVSIDYNRYVTRPAPIVGEEGVQ